MTNSSRPARSTSLDFTVQPRLETARLVLRPFTAEDAPSVQRLAGDVRIARGTTAVPHPYQDGLAEAWIAKHPALFAEYREIVFAIEESTSGALIGAVSLLNLSRDHARGEVGFWIGVDYWCRGYCTEAVEEIMRFGQGTLGVTKFVGRCLGWNLASAAVLKKVGMKQEGHLLKHELRDGQYVDQLVFGRMLKERGL